MNSPDLMRILRWLLPLAGAVATAATFWMVGIELAVLVLAGAVLLGVIVVLFSSLQALTGDTELSLEEALSLAVPSAEEEQKRAVLRTLKDLEYERSVGKISDEDYRELVATYRKRAKQLIQAVDEGIGQGKEQAERLVKKRLRAQAGEFESSAAPQRAASPATSEGSEPMTSQVLVADATDTSPAAEESASVSSGQRRACEQCATDNDRDARFCKGCGVALEAAS